MQGGQHIGRVREQGAHPPFHAEAGKICLGAQKALFVRFHGGEPRPRALGKQGDGGEPLRRADLQYMLRRTHAGAGQQKRQRVVGGAGIAPLFGCVAKAQQLFV